MSAASNYLELELLDHVLRYGNGSLNAGTGAGYQPPSTVYVALFSGTAGTVLTALESGTSTASEGNWGYYEVTTSGTAYARQSITFAAASAGSIASNATVSFPVASADYDNTAGSGATVTCMALMDNSTGGNVLFYGQLTNSKTVNSGDQFTISSGNLTVSLA